MVLVKDWPFFHLFFLGNIGQENVFCDILEQKNAFLGYKNKKLKKSKNWGFSKGVNPWFSSKIDHFPIVFFFFAIWARKVCFTIFYNEKKPFKAIKTKSSNSRKIVFPEELTHGFGQNWPFFYLLFLGNISHKNVFYDILERTNASLGYINHNFKTSIN